MKKSRQQILEIAIECFAQKGYDGTSMSSVAQAAGVSKASVFHHFSSKESLYEESIISALGDATDVWKKVGDELDATRDDFLKEFLAAMRFSDENEDVLKLLIFEMMKGGNEKIDAAIRQYMQELAQVFKGAMPGQQGKKPEEVMILLLALSCYHLIFRRQAEGVEALSLLGDSDAFSRWVISLIN